MNENAEITNIYGESNFLINICLKQNASYRGKLYWFEEDFEVSFHSLLELIILMHEAMTVSDEPKGEYILNSWPGLTQKNI